MQTNIIYNQNCFNILSRIPNKSVDMILTDIPYLISKETNFKQLKDYSIKEGDSKYQGMDYGDWDKEFNLELYLKECSRILKKSRSMIIWCSWQQLNQVNHYLDKYLSKTGVARIGIWEKKDPAVFNMDKMPISAREHFLWKRKDSNWIFNNQNPIRNKENKQIQSPEKLRFSTPTVKGGHPNEKPVSIFEYLIKTFTNPNQIIFDGCLGRGTTAISALNTNRKIIACEFTDKWFKKTYQRLNKKYEIKKGKDKLIIGG